MNTTRLGAVAEIQTGFSFRSGVATAHTGTCVVQLKDVSADGTITADALDRVEETFAHGYLLEQGDILFRSRGQTLTAAVMPQPTAPTITAAPLLRLRMLNKQTTLPEYIAWYLNSTPGQAYMESMAKQSSVKMIDRASLLAMEVPMPPPTVQDTIATMAMLMAKEKQLTSAILQKKEQILNAHIQRYLQENIQ